MHGSDGGLRSEPVTGSAHGLDHRCGRTQRFAQALHMHVDRALFDQRMRAPHLVDQLAAGIHAALVRQQEFFEVHIATWSGLCLDHLRQADGARFYGCVADFIAAYFEIEREAFEVAADFEAD